MSTKRATTRTNARNEDRYLVTIENPSYLSERPSGGIDTREILTVRVSSKSRARFVFKGFETKRIYKLVGSGRGVK